MNCLYTPPFDHVEFQYSKSADWREFFASRSILELDGRGRKVALVGGGISSLVSAFELTKRNFNVTVLERNPSVGGRIKTHRFSDGSYGELGAMRIPQAHACVLDYLSELGLSTHQFANWNPYGLFHLRGVREILSPPTNPASPFHERVWSQFPDLNVLRGDISAGAANILKSKLLSGLHAVLADTEMLSILHSNANQMNKILAQTLEEFATGSDVGLSLDDWEVLARLAGAAPLAKCTVQQFILDMLPIFDSPMMEVIGGMDRFVAALSKRLPDRAIETGCDVKGIEKRDKRLVIQFEKQGHCSEIEADYAIIAIPPSEVRKLQFVGTPASSGLAQQIGRLSTRPLFKCLTVCARPYWQKDEHLNAGGLLPTDTKLTQVWYPSPGSSNGNTMTAAYSFADFAEYWRDIVDANTVEARVRDELSLVHPDIQGFTEDLGEMAYEFWDTGYTYLTPQNYSNLLQSMATSGSLDEGLLFCGEHMGPMHGWIVSAIMPAQYCIEQLVRHAQ